VGSTVQSVCDAGFILIGEPVIRCTEDGVWSHPTPFCKRACRYPGPQAGGDITPVMFLYYVGDRIAVICHHGYMTTGKSSTGSSTLYCTETGEWSGTLPQCLDYTQ
jgi:lipid-binding SYLF domain-containing protein